jgi:hypothetical protein
VKFITIIIAIYGLVPLFGFAQSGSGSLITTDIDQFWQAYDQITATKDSTQQYNYINQLFINKGTPGLKAIMQVRNYTSKSYIDAINQYPHFWQSLRPNTYKANEYAADIVKNIAKLKVLYPALKPANIYFTIGAFKTGGTTQDDMVLIGSEISMADSKTDTRELVKSKPGLAAFIKTNPIKLLVFNNVHEYVHTQQKTTVGDNLLAQCVLEGVAEFMAEKATGKASTLPAIIFGKQNPGRVKKVFVSQMFNTSNGYWLYDDTENEFGLRDMGYYVGYAICSKYYAKAQNKASAIKQMIELDYNNQTALTNFVNQSGYLTSPVKDYQEAYNNSRPFVTGLSEINGVQLVSTQTTILTINFSAPMDKHYRNFELGPLGKDNLLRLKRFISFSEDGKSASFEVELQPSRHYQLLVGSGFRNMQGVNLKPYLIDFKTADR